MSIEKKLGLAFLGLLLAAFFGVLAIRLSRPQAEDDKVEVNIGNTLHAAPSPAALPKSAATGSATKPTQIAERSAAVSSPTSSGNPTRLTEAPPRLMPQAASSLMPQAASSSSGGMGAGTATGGAASRYPTNDQRYTVGNEGRITSGAQSAAAATENRYPSAGGTTTSNPLRGTTTSPDEATTASAMPPTTATTATAMPPTTAAPATIAPPPFAAPSLPTTGGRTPGVASLGSPSSNSGAAASTPAASASPYGSMPGGVATTPPGGGSAVPTYNVVAPIGPSSAPNATSSGAVLPTGGESTSAAAGNPIARASATTAGGVDKPYVVQPGDSFWSISQKVYGDGTYYRALFAYNSDRYPHAEDVRAGSVLDVPPIDVLKQRYSALLGQSKSTDEASALRGDATSSASQTYVVEAGDTLFEIARRRLGKASRWTEIYELNRATLGENLENLRPGVTLKLP